MGPKEKLCIDLMSDGKYWTVSELNKEGVDRRVRKRLKDKGVLTKHGTSFQLEPEYRKTVVDAYDAAMEECDLDNEHMLETFARAMLSGGDDSFICLYSAALFHGLSLDTNVMYTQIGIPHHRKRPSDDFEFTYIRSRSASYLKVGVEDVTSFDGVNIRVSSKERTIVDMFKNSPLNNVSDDAAVIIDEESVMFALSTYLASNEANPRLLIEIAKEFGVDEKIGLCIKYGAVEATPLVM